MTSIEADSSAVRFSTGHTKPSWLTRLGRATIAVITRLARGIAYEIAYLIQEDLAHGRIRRDPDDDI